MGDPRFVPGFVLVVLVTAAVLACLVAVGLSRPAASRAGLVAGGLPLALLAPVAASGFISGKVGGLFGGVAEFGPGGAQPLLYAAGLLWQLQRVAWAAFAAVCLVGLALGLMRSSGPAFDAASSARRSLLLLALPCLGLVVATAVTQRVAGGVRVAAAVLSSDPSDPASGARSDAVLAGEGLSTEGAGSLGATARYLTRTTFIGVFGGATVALVLLGLALPGFILAWRVRFGTGFLAVSSALWLVAAAAGILAALGLVKPLRFP
jgi:hypothetical protein